MRKDNRGFSLVEIIIVITLLTVLATAGILGVGMISGKPAERCAENIKVSLLNNRTTALGKFKSDVTISDSGSGIDLIENLYDKDDNIESTKTTKIGDHNVLVEWSVTDADSGYVPISSPLVFRFDRATGSVITPTGGDIYIRCSKSGKSYVVQVYHLTGKVVILN